MDDINSNRIQSWKKYLLIKILKLVQSVIHPFNQFSVENM